MTLTAEILARYGEARVPRYTSYPTAAQFSEAVGPEEYRAWLGELPPDGLISVYLHVPFCRSMCWFCGCHTTITRSDDAIRYYVGLLGREIELVTGYLPSRPRLGHLHFGGGSPTVLRPSELAGVVNLLRAAFSFTDGAEIAVEIDPRTLTVEIAAMLGEIGVNRASLGVQSFDPAVQKAVNRVQSFADTANAVDRLRAAGVAEVNLDLIYGFPQQTAASCRDTVKQALALRPDRFAVFGYAHLPDFKPHQKKIDEAALPSAAERWDQARAIAEQLLEQGYVAIGLDHFARPEDALAQAATEGRLHRNFQGYTADPCQVLLGFGASAIGRLPQGYAQNAVGVGSYAKRIEAGQLATVKGFVLGPEDRLRGAVIEGLMCHFRAENAESLALDPAELQQLIADGLVCRDGGKIIVSNEARPLVRAVAQLFDAYRHQTARRYARGL